MKHENIITKRIVLKINSVETRKEYIFITNHIFKNFVFKTDKKMLLKKIINIKPKNSFFIEVKEYKMFGIDKEFDKYFKESKDFNIKNFKGKAKSFDLKLILKNGKTKTFLLTEDYKKTNLPFNFFYVGWILLLFFSFLKKCFYNLKNKIWCV